MLATVLLVACCLLGGATAQQNPVIEKAAYQQVMVGCLGETPYRKYLESVAAALTECGGDVTDLQQAFNPGVSSLLRPSARLPPAQGISFPQPGAPAIQGLPGLTQRPGLPPPGLSPSVFNPQQGGFSPPPGTFGQRPGTRLPQQQFITQQPGFSTSQPGTFAQESGIFSLLDKKPAATPSTITDSVPSISSPVGPNYPGIRQKRQATVSLADIQRTRVHMRSLVNNFTCVLNKLAVVDNNLDLNIRGLTNSVVNLPVGGELKRDLVQSINYCAQSTQCLPLERLQLPVPPKLKRVMEYVKCEKEMRLKACHKHNLRQNLQNINLRGLTQDGSQFNNVEEIVNLMMDARFKHELDLF